MQNKYMIGQHCLLEIYLQDRAWLKDEQAIKGLLYEAAQTAQAHILNSHFHSFGGYGGVTGILLLAESHMSIHTWPEYHYAAVDIFMCGRLSMQSAIGVFQQELAGARIEIRLLQRGCTAKIHHFY
jgi:S-adenosylmethionine decarboxylase